MWEPIFIGTNLDPFYDERLTWEGRRDKMTQVRFQINISLTKKNHFLLSKRMTQVGFQINLYFKTIFYFKTSAK
jgi:hypothetical protein